MNLSIKQLSDGQWSSAFLMALTGDYAYGDDVAALCRAGKADAAPLGSDVSTAGFAVEDVKKIIGIQEGENDGAAWEICGQLKDGRYFLLTAGCDYTGWDCQAGGSACVAKNRRDIVKWGLTDELREKWGL